ncbi:DUF447 domain-containing protein [Methanoplanus limicola]|uniref:DUF447 family protein n=1 Tax=Methanoplanus limicola DSM 2279 TaxID=937775 RepID=H1Z1R5_9EURY|nr:DUF447 domain-containing protein [Methanoplanus limicola]EHQ34591.1 protein of unknown function DUF447 [Methanoplanus limicola DSM 2279]
MGLLCGGINEIIATTVSRREPSAHKSGAGLPEREFNAAPIGIINRDNPEKPEKPEKPDSLKMVLFHGTHTAENIAREGIVVANFIYDPVIYVKTAFGDIDDSFFAGGKCRYRSLHSGEEKDTDFCYLKNAEAWILFSAEVERDTGEALIVNLTPIREQTGSIRIHPVNRGFSSIIEATVHGTRYVMNRDPHLLELINHHASLVRKCGGRRELEALEILINYINLI